MEDNSRRLMLDGPGQGHRAGKWMENGGWGWKISDGVERGVFYLQLHR